MTPGCLQESPGITLGCTLGSSWGHPGAAARQWPGSTLGELLAGCLASPACLPCLPASRLREAREPWVGMGYNMYMEALFRNMLRGLELAGRDWRRIDRCLWEWERELDGLAGLQAWAGDYREFLLGKYGEVLDRLILDAVAREEFERAEACLQRKKRLFPEESL